MGALVACFVEVVKAAHCLGENPEICILASQLALASYRFLDLDRDAIPLRFRRQARTNERYWIRGQANSTSCSAKRPHSQSKPKIPACASRIGPNPRWWQ